MKCNFPAFLLIAILVSACSSTIIPAGPTYTTRVLNTPETRELKGHQKPYTVNGKRYDPLKTHDGFVEEGLASWYGKDFHGKKTSNGEIYDMHAMTAAHKTLPLGVYVRVRNKNNGRETVVRINDRGPFVDKRVIDLSYAAADKLDIVGPGTVPVRVEALGYRETDSAGRTAFRAPVSYKIGTFSVQVGAFTVRANAENLALDLRRRFGAAAVHEGWVNGNLFYRVRVGKYGDLDEAEAAKIQFERGEFSNCFVVAME